MWSTPNICIACILFGTLCDIKQVSPQVRTSQGPAPDGDADLQEEILQVIDQIHSLSRENKNDASGAKKSNPNLKPDHLYGASSRAGISSLLDGVDLNAYYSILSNLYAVYVPLLSERFINDFPQSIVCILSGRQDCGLGAELTKTVSLELAKPFLALLSSVRSETCRDAQTAVLLRSYIRMDEMAGSEFNGVEEMLITALSHMPVTGNLMLALSGLLDMAVTFISRVMATLIRGPLDYVKIALQFGIKIPSLNESEQCQQGDLKQLIMWGMKHNVSWSFAGSLLDILLAPEQTVCSYPGPECPSPNSLFRRSSGETGTNGGINQDILFQCNRHNLAVFNETSCADILTARQNGEDSVSVPVFAFCQSLSWLSPVQLERVWSNMCHVIQTLLFPVLAGPPDCGGGNTLPPPVLPPPPSPRVARVALNLNQLLCNYNNWSKGAVVVDPGLLTLCSDNDRDEFVKQVCDNAVLMAKLVSDRKNHWLWEYCGKYYSDPHRLVSQFCHYQSWKAHPTVQVPSALVAFCWNVDHSKLKELVCEDVGLFSLLFSNPENAGLIPNCTYLPPLAPEENLDVLVGESCRYSEWHDVTLVTLDILSLCLRLDSQNFATGVCANTTFLSTLLRNEANAWLEDYCAMSLSDQHTEPPLFFSITDWCNYHTWDSRQVDPTVVGLCWHHDQSAFNNNVCCNPQLFKKLTLDPQNEWLLSVCKDKDVTEMIPRVCRYSEWSRPIIVDMTDLALCAEIDPFNFTSRVCFNSTVLQNLLANLDNTWLLKHCANASRPGEGGAGAGAGPGGGLLGFRPSEQCQYSSWAVVLPGEALLALCWDYDQANFVATVCPNARLVSMLAQESSTVWVSQLCASYPNHSANANSSGETQPCVARELVRRFNWSCSADLAHVCRPGASAAEALQVALRCWVETLVPRLERLLPQGMASMLNQVVSVTMVMLVGLEESQLTTLHVTENIRLSVLESIARHLEMETNFDNKRVLLQCFGKVLTSLMQTGRDVTSRGSFLTKEYFRIPLGSLSGLLREVDITTARQILQYYRRNKSSLQLTDEYLSVMVSAFLRVHLLKDSSLFPELAPLLPRASPTDIRALPLLQANRHVREAINLNLPLMSEAQRQAFGQWYSRTMAPLNMTAAPLSLIGDTGNVIAYLPFHSFQHLSPAQLLVGVEVLRRNQLSLLQQHFIAQSIISTYRNLTVQDFTRLGNLSCLAEPADLLLYRDSDSFPLIQDAVMTCARQGLFLPSNMISSLFLNGSELRSPTSLPPSRLSELAQFLPRLGVDFLQKLSKSQLLSAFPALASVPFTPAQARTILDKMPPSYTSAPGALQALGSLVVGVKVETVWTLSADTLLSSLPAIVQNTAGLSPPQTNAIATKLWGFPGVVNWLEKVSPLLSSTPLLSMLPRTTLLLANKSTITQPWNTQQAKVIFREVMQTQPDIAKEDFLTLGTVGQGVSCPVLRRLFLAQPSSSSAKDILRFLRGQPTLLHTSLKKCVIDELYQFEFFSELLEELGAEIALALPVSTIKKFPADMMDTLRNMVLQDRRPFLRLPRSKQELLVDKMVQRLGMYTGEYTEEELLSLGVMATFVADEVFMQLRRRFLLDNLEFLKGFCYSASKREMVAAILQEPECFGPVQTWTKVTISQVGRFLFFLSKDKVKMISPVLLTFSHLERLFVSQSQWERSEVGLHCMKNSLQEERLAFFDKQQFVLQYFLGFLTTSRLSSPVLTPSCEMLHTTAPSLWTTDSLIAMSTKDFSNCLELIGHDPFLSAYQGSRLLKKAKEVHGPVSSLSPSVISQLGALSVHLSLEELASLRLTQISSISALGAVSTWTNQNLAVLFSTVLNSTKLSPSQLDSSTLVAMGHIVCGAKPAEIRTFNAVEFSKAALWLGQLRLSCSEDQLVAMVTLLTHSLAFGATSSWDAAVFIEIGALAAGLPDMSMSALVKGQIEGVTPLAVSLIPPEKFSVVFDHSRINMFSYEQAVVVTAEQRAKLSDVQQMALALVLTPWEDRPVDFRGRSSGLALSFSPLCLLLGLLMLLICPASQRWNKALLAPLDSERPLSHRITGSALPTQYLDPFEPYGASQLLHSNE